MTAGQYLRRIRVAEAVCLLKHSDETLTEIALETGFADQSHRGRYLEGFLGQTPASFGCGPESPAASI